MVISLSIGHKAVAKPMLCRKVMRGHRRRASSGFAMHFVHKVNKICSAYSRWALLFDAADSA
jgi:hypothetical protein